MAYIIEVRPGRPVPGAIYDLNPPRPLRYVSRIDPPGYLTPRGTSATHKDKKMAMRFETIEEAQAVVDKFHTHDAPIIREVK